MHTAVIGSATRYTWEGLVCTAHALRMPVVGRMFNQCLDRLQSMPCTWGCGFPKHSSFMYVSSTNCSSVYVPLLHRKQLLSSSVCWCSHTCLSSQGLHQILAFNGTTRWTCEAGACAMLLPHSTTYISTLTRLHASQQGSITHAAGTFWDLLDVCRSC